MTTTTSYPRIDHIAEHYGLCVLHGIPCCAVCCKHEAECDYGQCNAPAVECLPCYGPTGKVIEQRPTCAQHAVYSPLGVGFDLKAESIRAAVAPRGRKVA